MKWSVKLNLFENFDQFKTSEHITGIHRFEDNSHQRSGI